MIVFEKRCQTRCHRVLPRRHRVLSCNVFHKNLALFSVIYLSSALKTRNLAQIPMKHVLESLKKRATSTPQKRERRNETRCHRVRPDGSGHPMPSGRFRCHCVENDRAASGGAIPYVFQTLLNEYTFNDLFRSFHSNLSMGIVSVDLSSASPGQEEQIHVLFEMIRSAKFK